MAAQEASEALLGGQDGNRDRRPAEGPLPCCGRVASALCDPQRWPHRFVVLVLMCFLGFGSYFCYDNPAALQTQVMNDMQVNTVKFMQLYAWYSWPNVILCFFGGFLLDRIFGIRLGTIIFSLFVCVGQVIVATGALLNAFWLMELGRFVFGIGGESLAVAQNTYAVSWFKGKELNLVFGLQLSMARLGSTVNMNIMGWVYSRATEMVGSVGYRTLGISLMIAASTCVFSLLCAFIIGYLDRRAKKILHKDQGKTGDVVKLTDVKDFPLSLWLIFLICVFYYVAVFPFIGLGKVFFIEKFNFSLKEASFINSIVYIISAPASPILGIVMDKVGKNIFWVMFAVLMTLAAHMMLAFTFWNPWIAMCLLGASYSLLACALWPMVAFVVPEHQLGTAYGFMQSIQNLGLAVIAIAAGSILDSKGYLLLEVFFCACLCVPSVGFINVRLVFSFYLPVAVIAVVMLYFVDLLSEGDLNVTAWKRSKLQAAAAAEAAKEERIRQQQVEDLARIQPMNAFAVRNRYLSRLGAQLPEHYTVHGSALAYRSVLK